MLSTATRALEKGKCCAPRQCSINGDGGGSSGYTVGTTAREEQERTGAAPSQQRHGTEDGRAQAGPEVQGRGPTRAPSHNGPPKTKRGRGGGGGEGRGGKPRHKAAGQQSNHEPVKLAH